MIANAGKNVEYRNFYLLLLKMQNDTTTLEDSLVLPFKTKLTFHVWSSNCTSGIYPNEIKIYFYMETCMWMFMVSIFIIDKIWKHQDIFQNVDGLKCMVHPYNGIKCMVHPYNGIIVKKKKEVPSHKRSEGILSLYCKVKEANLWRLHPVWRQVNNIFKKVFAKHWGLENEGLITEAH